MRVCHSSFVVCCGFGGGLLLVVVRWLCVGRCWLSVEDVWLVLDVRRLMVVVWCLLFGLLLVVGCWLLMVVGCCWLFVVGCSVLCGDC